MREKEIKEKEKNLDSLAGDLADSQGGAALGPADQELGELEPPAAQRRPPRSARRKK
jgi:hypothetical protein